MMTPGECLRKYRLRAGYTQAQVAEMVNVGKDAVSVWERDKAMPRPFTLWDLADIYGTSIDELIGRVQKDGE